MSRSNPTPTNPAQHFFTWSGSKGQLEWYDKENQKRVPVKLPFEFLVLDQLATMTGFSEPDQSSYWSNEVRNVTKDEFQVKTSKGTKQVGLYKDLADVRSKGAKYAKSIYIAHKIKGEWVIGNIKASGAALTAWIELGSKYQVGNGKCVLTGAGEAKKGTNEYFVPVFEWTHSDTDEDSIAIDLDKELQVYLSQYLAAAEFNRNNMVEQVDELGETTYDKEDLPLSTQPEEDDQAAIDRAKRADDAVIDDFGGEAINLNDIPF